MQYQVLLIIIVSSSYYFHILLLAGSMYQVVQNKFQPSCHLY